MTVRQLSLRNSSSVISGDLLSGTSGAKAASEQERDGAQRCASFVIEPFKDASTSAPDEVIQRAARAGRQIIYKDRRTRIAELAYLGDFGSR